MTWYPLNVTNSNRLTKRQQAHFALNDLIARFFAARDEFSSAEDLWLDMRAKGHTISISSFYSRVKELVEKKVIEKKPVGYNKYLYRILNPPSGKEINHHQRFL